MSAHDDPAVPHSQFAEAAASNPWVLAHETPLGGHFAFDLAYGTDYVDRVWSALEQPEVLGNWTAVRR